MCQVKDRQLSRGEFLNLKVYRPGSELGWMALKFAVAFDQSCKEDDLTVRQIAQYLLDHRDFSPTIDPVEGVNNLYQRFDRSKLSIDSRIEICPDKSSNTDFLLQGGNKRSIAYSMRILEGSLIYEPVVVSLYPVYDRSDAANREGKKTEKGKIL